MSFQYAPDIQFARLGPEYADAVQAAGFPEPVLRYRNQRAARTVGLDSLTDDDWIRHFARFEALDGNMQTPLAMRYHGHQFRTYNPDLGDGRGFLFAQLREAESGRLLDLATKGTGQTPWSRGADGRLTLKGAVREVLAASLLEARGVPTCRIFSVVETGETLSRPDEPSPTRGAAMVRLSHSHIRFGTFQRLASLERTDLIRGLLDHVVEQYFPWLEREQDQALAVFTEVVARSARLVARWMAAGFVHGVLNTDNMVVTGESFDYGPWRFLPHNDPDLVAAYFDHAGLYSFGRQPEAVLWNLSQLGGSLTGVTSTDALSSALDRFADTYRAELRQAICLRLGVEPRGELSDTRLANAVFRLTAQELGQLSWEGVFFDWCGGAAAADRAMQGPRSAAYRGEAAAELRAALDVYDTRPGLGLTDSYFCGTDPVDLVYETVEKTWEPIARSDDWMAFEQILVQIEQARQALQSEPQLRIHHSGERRP